MTHTITLTTIQIWHDLTEDPNDLPESNINSWLVLCRDAETERLYCLHDDEEIRFEPDKRIWMTNDDEGWTYGIRSYGIDPVITDQEEPDEWFSAEIVAWAEETKGPRITYVPAAYRELKEVTDN